MKPRIPKCENRAPYCPRGGQEMRCVKETAMEWVFACSGCEQVNVITKPEYKRAMREQVRHTNGIRVYR